MKVAIIGRGHLGIVAVETVTALRWDLQRVVTNHVEPEWDAPLLSNYVRRFCPKVELDQSGDWRKLIGLELDLILSVQYDRIIKAPLAGGRVRILNLHLGKLPEYRGMRPVNWALKNGERVAGVTLHEIDSEGIDDGPIVAQATFSIHPEVDEVRDVYGRAVRAGAALLRDTLPIIKSVGCMSQDESRACYYSAADMPKLGNRLGWTRAES